MTLGMIEFVGLQDALGSQHDVALAAATLLQRKGPKGSAHGEAWW